MPELTQNQKAAIARDKNMAVTAGAGTGKTLVLVERYIDILVREDVDIHQLLAITFTNKAASEMIDRVALRIELLIENEQNDQNLKKLIHIRNHLSSAYISTIHAFCARILREFPVEAEGLDPGFGQLNEIQSEFLVSEAIEEEFARLKNDDEFWLELFRLFGAGNIKSILIKALEHRFEMQGVLKIYQEKTSEDLFNSLKIYFMEQVTGHFSADYLSGIRDLTVKILDDNKSDTNSNEKKIRVLLSLRNFQNSGTETETNFWQKLFQLATLMTKTDGGPYVDVRTIGGKKVWSAESISLLIRLSDALSRIAIWMNKNISVCPDKSDLYIIKNLKKIYQLYESVEKRYTDLKQNMSSVDYDDLQILTLRLIKKNPDIKSQIASRFRYIMVDEFQDTNQLQWEIISQISDGKDGKLFIVGDPKQSIYGFRGADVRVFDRVKKKFRAKNPAGDHCLSESFRFKDAISDFLNQIFSGIMNEDPQNPWEVGYNPVETERPDSKDGALEFALLSNESGVNEQIEFLVSRIKDLLNDDHINPGDIAVILRARTHLSEIEKQFRTCDIPFMTISGIGFYQGQEIYDTYYLLKFLINPADDFALVGLLRSPFANISDTGLFFLSFSEEGINYWQRLHHLDKIKNIPDEDIKRLKIFFENARRWTARRDRVGYYELMSDIFNESLYRGIVSADFKGEQILANIDKIMNTTLAFERGQISSILDYTNSLKRLINTQTKEGDAVINAESSETVKILTIHQAKGLEFPVVFLPFLEQQNKSTEKKSAYFSDKFGLASKLQSDNIKYAAEHVGSHYLYELLKQEQRSKEIAELKRLFYVGCSRAENHLIMSAGIKSDKIPSETPLSWLLDGLQSGPESLSTGRYDLSKNSQIQIYREYKKYEPDSEEKRLHVFNSLKQLRRAEKNLPDKGIIPDKLSEIMDQPKGEIFSATQLMTYLSDRSEYHRRYHLGFFEDDYEKIGMGIHQEEDALLKGVILHSIMEVYPEYDLDAVFDDLDLTDTDKIGRLKMEVNQLLVQVRNSSQILPVFQSANFRCEVNILRKIGTDFITGTLDRLYEDNNGRWMIIDYKTNQIKKNDILTIADRYQVQVEIYALLLASVYTLQKEYRVGLYFIYPDHIVWQTFDKEQIKQLEKKYESIIQKIKQYYPYSDQPVMNE